MSEKTTLNIFGLGDVQDPVNIAMKAVLGDTNRAFQVVEDGLELTLEDIINVYDHFSSVID